MINNYNAKVNKIRLLIEKKRHTEALMLITSSLEELMKSRYYQLHSAAPEAKRLEMEEIKNSAAKGRPDDKIGLGQWIGIYRKCGLFDENQRTFNPANLDKINSARNEAAHAAGAKRGVQDEANASFVILVNAMRDLGHNIDPKVHRLCEFCLQNKKEKPYKDLKGKEWLLCNRCNKITLGMKSLMEKHKNKLPKIIFDIRVLNVPTLREKYKKYMPPERKNYLESTDYFHERFSPFLSPSIETKKEERLRLREEKKAEEKTTIFEKWKEEAQEKVYKEPEQNEILKKLYTMVSTCHDDDGWLLEDLLGSDIIIPMLYEEIGITFSPKNKRILSDSSFSQKEHEELEMILAGHPIYNDFMKHMSILEAICNILNFVLKYYEAAHEMKETLIYGYLPIINNDFQLKDFLNMFRK